MKSAYSLSPEEFGALVVAQDGVCAICGDPPSGGRKHLNVDHDHDTGAVRGLLCWACNSALGKFKDSPELLEAAAAYLRHHKTKKAA